MGVGGKTRRTGWYELICLSLWAEGIKLERLCAVCCCSHVLDSAKPRPPHPLPEVDKIQLILVSASDSWQV